MQHSNGVLIKKDKNTLASTQTKVQVMHYTDNNEEVFFTPQPFCRFIVFCGIGLVRLVPSYIWQIGIKFFGSICIWFYLAKCFNYFGRFLWFLIFIAEQNHPHSSFCYLYPCFKEFKGSHPKFLSFRAVFFWALFVLKGP